jgi:SNF2 family DNA or RNA helicase
MPSFIYESMRPYQRAGAHFLRKAGNALLADEPGLGKTIQTLGSILAVSRLDKQHQSGPEYHLIVAPKVAVRNVWEPEIRRWFTDVPHEILPLMGKVADRQRRLREFEPLEGTQHVFVIVNIESLRIKPVKADTQGRHDVIRWSVKTTAGKEWRAYAPENGIMPELFSLTWDTIVCDESHRALIRTKGGGGEPCSQTRAGLVLVTGKRKVALSGTPMRGKPEQLWGTLDWLEAEVGAYWTWVKRYFRLTSNGFSSYVIDQDEPFKANGESDLARDLQRVMLRRTKAEVAPDLPPKTYAGYHLDANDERSPLGIWLDMSPTQRKLYDQLEREGFLVGDDGSELPVEGTLALYTRQRQIATSEHRVIDGALQVVAAGPKLDWLLAWLEENEGEKIIVVSQYTSVLKAWESSLADVAKTARIDGTVSDSRRTKAVDGFQNGDLQVMLLNIAAGGVALTLDQADYVVFLDETSIPDDRIQAEDRAHRISRIHNVTIYILRTLGTIEEEVAWVAAARQDVQQYLLDGARGVEAAKRIFYTTTGKAA